MTDSQEFIKRYRAEVLDKLDPRQVLQDLGGDNFIMLCWEAPGEFCHRRVVAAWFRKELGITVDEFDPKLRSHAAWMREYDERSQL